MTRDKLKHIEYISIVILLYLGIFGFIPHFFITNHLDLNIVTSLTIITISFLVIFVVKQTIKIGKLNTAGYALFIFYIFLFIRSFFLPVSGWDTYSLYDARAKVFLQGGDYDTLFNFSNYDIYNGLYYFSYPPMTSNLHLIAYKLGLNTPMPVYALFFISYSLITVYWILRTTLVMPMKYLLFLVSNFHYLIYPMINSGYTNLPMLAFQVGAFHIILESINGSKLVVKTIAFSLLLSFSIWTRITEPTYLAFIIAWAYIVMVNKTTKYKAFIIAIPLIIVLFIRKYWIDFSNYYIKQVLSFSTLEIKLSIQLLDAFLIGNLLNVIQHFIYALKPISNMLIIPPAIMIINLITKKFNNRSISLFIIFTSIVVIEFSGLIYVSAYYEWWNKIPDSLLRTSLILIPLSLLTYIVNYVDK